MDRPKILLIVNDKRLRPAFSGLFKRLGCQVLTTIWARDALAAMEKSRPDVILADMAYEDMQPDDFLRKIKSFPTNSFVPYYQSIVYKIVEPSLLSDAARKAVKMDPQISAKATAILKEHVALVPGEIVLWVAEVLDKNNISVPPLMSAAAEILRNCKV